MESEVFDRSLSPYSEEALRQRDLQRSYYLAADKVRELKEKILIRVFDDPNYVMDYFEDPIGSCLYKLLHDKFDAEGHYLDLLYGLTNDGDLEITPDGPTYHSKLTNQGIERVGQKKLAEIQSQILTHKTKL